VDEIYFCWSNNIYLLFFWSIPVTLISALANLWALCGISWLDIHIGVPDDYSFFIKGVVQELLPSLLLAIFMNLLPLLLNAIFLLRKFHTHSEHSFGVTVAYFSFLLLNVLLITTIAGSIFSVLDESLEHPTAVIQLLSSSLPLQSTFFINYIMIQCFGVFGTDTVRIGSFIVTQIQKLFCTKTQSEKRAADDPGDFPYSSRWPQDILIFVIGITYSTMSPLVLPFIVVYFGFAWFSERYNLIYVYKHRWDTGGLYMPYIITFMFIGTLIYQLTMVGVLGLFVFAYAPIALLLLITTIVYWIFIHARFITRASGNLPLELCREADSEEDLYTPNEWKSAYIQPELQPESAEVLIPDEELLSSGPINGSYKNINLVSTSSFEINV